MFIVNDVNFNRQLKTISDEIIQSNVHYLRKLTE